MYELYVVIVYEGLIFGGYYYVYVNLIRNYNDERWQCFVKRLIEEDDEYMLWCKVDIFF